MNITVVTVGKIKEKYINMGIDEFSKRLKVYCKLKNKTYRNRSFYLKGMGSTTTLDFTKK